MKAMSLHCPGCLSKDVRRSRHTGVFAAILAQFGLHPYRCRNCRKRFFRDGDFETAWDVDGPPPVLAKLPAREHSDGQLQSYRRPPCSLDQDSLNNVRSSLAVRKRDLLSLLARGRVA